jgi:hypothetical protein
VSAAVELSGSEWLLYTAADAQRELGIPAGTVRSWASREWLYSFGLDRVGRPMYRGQDLIRLRDNAGLTCES